MRFDLKHDAGGMVDVEFAVQYLVLAHAHAHPALTRNLGNIALLRDRRRPRARRARRSPPPPPMPTASSAGCSTRSRLTGAAHARVDPEPQAERRAAVEALWDAVFGGSQPAAERA